METKLCFSIVLLNKFKNNGKSVLSIGSTQQSYFPFWKIDLSVIICGLRSFNDRKSLSSPTLGSVKPALLDHLVQDVRLGVFLYWRLDKGQLVL